MITMITLFFVGLVDMIIVTVWTRVVVETRVLMSGVMTLLNVLIWYYVLEKIVSDISNIWLVVFYAVGCAIGTMIATAISTPTYLEQWEKLARLLRELTTKRIRYDITG